MKGEGSVVSVGGDCENSLKSLAAALRAHKMQSVHSSHDLAAFKNLSRRNVFYFNR